VPSDATSRPTRFRWATDSVVCAVRPTSRLPSSTWRADQSTIDVARCDAGLASSSPYLSAQPWMGGSEGKPHRLPSHRPRRPVPAAARSRDFRAVLASTPIVRVPKETPDHLLAPYHLWGMTVASLWAGGATGDEKLLQHSGGACAGTRVWREAKAVGVRPK